MIQTKDAIKLASTKLRTRRIRLIVTVVISSLVFSVLVFASVVTQGIISSVKDFGSEGYGGRYLIQALPLTDTPDPFDSDLAAKLKPIQENLIKQKQDEAKKLGIDYNPQTDQNLPLQEYKNPSGTSTQVNYSSTVLADMYTRDLLSIEGLRYVSFQKTAQAAGATNTFWGSSGATIFGYSAYGASQSISAIKNSKETLPDPSSQQSFYSTGGEKGLDSITAIGWRGAEAALVKPFTLQNTTLEVGRDGSIPIIAPYSAAEEVLGLEPLPKTASSTEKVERLRYVRENIADKTAELCYRNGSSYSLLSEAVQQDKEISAKKTDKDYVAPSLIYQLPETPCGAVTIKSDTRSSAEKTASNNQQLFDKKFDQYVDPVQKKIIVRIVGINPDVKYEYGIDASSILASFLQSSLGSGWVSPSEALETNDAALSYTGGKIDEQTPNNLIYYAEFTSLEAMKSFIKDQQCDQTDVISTPQGAIVTGKDFFGQYSAKKCYDQGKFFVVNPYGNSAGAIEDFRAGFWKVARVAILIVVILASVIMMGNIGKIIADSQRETAVFRALGAKHLDIAQIYLTYTVMVSILVFVSAAILGIAGAIMLNNHYSTSLSVEAIIAYNAQDLSKQFLLYGMNYLHLAIIAGLVVASGLLSALIPLSHNMSRNPIKDMRDER